MMRSRRDRTRGANMVEFTLVGIPLIFILITTFEVTRGMWMYQTLAAAVKEGTRYAVVHGKNCALSPNSCTVTISQIATRIQNSGPGLSGSASAVSLTFTDSGGNSTTCTLSNCIANYTSSAWPSSTYNAVGQAITISGTFTFDSVICMLWPGGGGTYGPSGTLHLSAYSTESIQF